MIVFLLCITQSILYGAMHTELLQKHWGDLNSISQKMLHSFQICLEDLVPEEDKEELIKKFSAIASPENPFYIMLQTEVLEKTIQLSEAYKQKLSNKILQEEFSSQCHHIINHQSRRHSNFNIGEPDKIRGLLTSGLCGRDFWDHLRNNHLPMVIRYTKAGISCTNTLYPIL